MPDPVNGQGDQADATLSQVDALVAAVRSASDRLDRSALPATIFRPGPQPRGGDD